MENQSEKHRKNWLIQAPVGLVLVGFGLCLVVESAFLKSEAVATWKWVLAGTFSLVVFNSGLCIFGNSILEKVRSEKEE